MVNHGLGVSVSEELHSREVLEPAWAMHAAAAARNGAARSLHPLGASSDALEPASGDDRADTDRGGEP